MAVPAEGHLPRPHQHLRSSPSSPSAIGTAIILPADQYKYVTAFIGFPLILSWNWAALLCPCNSSPVNGLFMSFAHFSTASLWRIDMKEFLIIGSLLLVWGALFLSQVLVLCLLQTFLETFQHWQHSLQKSLAPESVETGTNPEKGTNVTALGGFGAQTPICYFLCKKKKKSSASQQTRCWKSPWGLLHGDRHNPRGFLTVIVTRFNYLLYKSRAHSLSSQWTLTGRHYN